MSKKLKREQLFPMVCRNNEVMDSLWREACEKYFEYFKDMSLKDLSGGGSAPDTSSGCSDDNEDPAGDKGLRVRPDMALTDGPTFEIFKKLPFSLFDTDDLSYEAGKEYFVYLTRDIGGRYRIRLMPISYYEIMKTVPDYMRQKPYEKTWHKGFKGERISAEGGMLYQINTDRWDLIGSIRKNGKTPVQISFGVAPKAYDAYNATLKYIEKSGLLERYTFEEAYDKVVDLTDKACSVLERYVDERNLSGMGYRRGYTVYEHPDALKTACRKILPDGKRLYPVIKRAYVLRDVLASYRFHDWPFQTGFGGRRR